MWENSDLLNADVETSLGGPVAMDAHTLFNESCGRTHFFK